MARRTDFTQAARRVVDQVTGEGTDKRRGDPGAVAPQPKATTDERSEHARKAARARWDNRKASA